MKIKYLTQMIPNGKEIFKILLSNMDQEELISIKKYLKIKYLTKIETKYLPKTIPNRNKILFPQFLDCCEKVTYFLETNI